MKSKFQNSITRLSFLNLQLEIKLLGQIPVNDEMKYIENKF